MPIQSDVHLGKNVEIFHPDLVNLYGCNIVDDTKICVSVENQKNVYMFYDMNNQDINLVVDNIEECYGYYKLPNCGAQSNNIEAFPSAD